MTNGQRRRHVIDEPELKCKEFLLVISTQYPKAKFLGISMPTSRINGDLCFIEIAYEIIVKSNRPLISNVAKSSSVYLNTKGEVNV